MVAEVETSEVASKTYVSRFANHRFWIRAPRLVRDRNGEVIDNDLGHQIEFRDFKYTTRDPVEQAWLDARLGPELMVLEDGHVVSRGGPEVSGGLSTASVVDEKKRYRCEDCGKAFAQPQHLMMHRKTHAKARRQDEEGITPPLD